MFGENCGSCSPGGDIGANLQSTGSSPLNWWGSVGKRPGPVMSVEKQAEVGIQHSQSRFLQRWVLGGFHGGGMLGGDSCSWNYHPFSKELRQEYVLFLLEAWFTPLLVIVSVHKTRHQGKCPLVGMRNAVDGLHVTGPRFLGSSLRCQRKVGMGERNREEWGQKAG